LKVELQPLLDSSGAQTTLLSTIQAFLVSSQIQQ
jgi:hypothetical protein